jgi:3-deoxy-D-manno-octulosonic-acid transferase
MIARRLYSILWGLLTPLVRRYLKKRAQKSPAYLENWDERFGRYFVAGVNNVIWIHAVSVGETRAAAPLISLLHQRWPDFPLLITQMTPTGRDCAISLYGDLATICYLPYDYPGAVQRFIGHYQPKFGVLMETEIWPNLIHAAHQADVPLFLANARMSEKSFNGYRKLGCLIRDSLQKLTAVAAQSEADAIRLQQLGAREPVVCGNTKYDISAPTEQISLGESFRQRIGKRQVIVCASTRDGEEKLILEAWKQQQGDCLLVLVPRHPERFRQVGELARQSGFSIQYRSDQQPVDGSTRIWIGDSMGEMFAYYQAADLVLIGGSLLPFGGQNLIEPASLGVPVLMGPSTYNFSEASAKAFSCGAAIQIKDSVEFVDLGNNILSDDSTRLGMKKAALEYSAAHRGASLKIVEMIRCKVESGAKQCG